jgi:hypothetical protein
MRRSWLQGMMTALGDRAFATAPLSRILPLAGGFTGRCLDPYLQRKLYSQYTRSAVTRVLDYRVMIQRYFG